MGTVSEWLWRIGRRLFGRNFTVPRWIDIPLRAMKYLLLGFFIWVVSAMGIDQISAFMNSPYYMLSDAKMLFFFTRMSAMTAGVLLSLAVLSMWVKNFWCRYLCPYGALLGLAAMIGPTRIRRYEEYCTRCRACDRVCPANLPVSKKPSIINPECVGCMACVDACPQKGALAMHSPGFGDAFWSPFKAGVCIALFFVLTVFMGSITGHWRGSIADHEFIARINTIDSPETRHPSIYSPIQREFSDARFR